MKRKILTLVALAAALVVAGCDYSATVEFRTDAQGKVKAAQIVKSSGREDLDRQAMVAAKRQFARKVPRPLPNRTYSQPVIIQ